MLSAVVLLVGLPPVEKQTLEIALGLKRSSQQLSVGEATGLVLPVQQAYSEPLKGMAKSPSLPALRLQHLLFASAIVKILARGLSFVIHCQSPVFFWNDMSSYSKQRLYLREGPLLLACI